MIGITMGDPNGVGPEIVVRAATSGILPEEAVVYGDASVIEYAARRFGLRHSLGIEDAAFLDASRLRPGTIDADAGAAALEYVRRATLDALSGRIEAVVTLPINKEATRLSFPGFTGHTEYIAGLCGDPPVTMMLASERLIVTHVSTHVSLGEAIRRVTRERILEVIELTAGAVTKLKPRCRIAVAGLNPHAGEHGAFGREDDELIAPAVEEARSRGFDVSGPEPGDTVFHNAVHRDRFDAVVCMYHDQGHIPMKTLDFDGGVNVTLGLPIVRTSVDHGTAYDIAYQGIASLRSFELALGMARSLR